MERHSNSLLRAFTCSSLTFLAFGTGCRSTGPEVPPHRPFAIQNRQAPPISYSGLDNSPADGLPAVTVGSPNGYGTPAPGANTMYGAPTANKFGAPGTSTLGTLPGGDATKPVMMGVNPQATGAALDGRSTQPPSMTPFAPQ